MKEVQDPFLMPLCAFGPNLQDARFPARGCAILAVHEPKIRPSSLVPVVAVHQNLDPMYRDLKLGPWHLGLVEWRG